MALGNLIVSSGRFMSAAALAALGAALLTACSGSDFDEGFGGAGGTGGGGNGPVMELRSFNVVGNNGVAGTPSSPAVVSTNSNALFSLDWDLTARGINNSYRATAQVVSLSGSNQGESIEVLARNCNLGVNTGCAQGVTSFPCGFLPERNGLVVSCPPSDADFAGRNLMSFFSESAGLPGTYRVEFEACGFREGTGTSLIDDVCESRSVNVRFQ